MEFFTCGLIAVLVVLYMWFKISSNSRHKFPPGPEGLPIVGSLFHIKPATAHHQYTELAKQYGDIFSVNMAGSKYVVINSGKANRDAFVEEEFRDIFAGRPDGFFVKYCDSGPSTSFADFGDHWKRQRRIMMKVMKINKAGKNSIEKTIREQLDATVEIIQNTGGKPFDIKTVVVSTLANIIAILIAGKRYDIGHPLLQTMIAFAEVGNKIQSGHVMTILTAFPFLRFVPFWHGKLYWEHMELFEDLQHYLVDVPKETFDPEVNRGFMDTLFSIQKEEDWLSDEIIRGLLRETVNASLGTTRAALMIFFLILLHRPEVMRRIQTEIDETIGRERPSALTDKSHMPYTEAVTTELLRYTSVVPLGIPHTTTKDVEFKGYVLPKGTVVIANQWAIHHDEKVWKDPWEFRPERFLDETLQFVHGNDEQRSSWVPFGAGRRACYGETFARSRMFLFITTLLQKFDFLPCEGGTLPSYDARSFDVGGLVHDPVYKTRAVPRQL